MTNRRFLLTKKFAIMYAEELCRGLRKHEKGVVMNMTITYLFHSGFAVELEKHILLFDYYTGEDAAAEFGLKQKIELPVWDKDKQLAVFISHKHHDHFDMAVFGLIQKYPHVHLFLGSDVKLSERYLERNGVNPAVKQKLTNIGKNRCLECTDVEAVSGMTDMKIETLRSTDAGVAFLVQTEGKCFYHAGDLNWWHWEGEPEPFNTNMARAYCKEIDAIAGRHFDVAFVPLDPRLEGAYGYGMDYFLDKVQADYVFPMHMWGRYDLILQYKKEREAADAGRRAAGGTSGDGRSSGVTGSIMEITHELQQFEIR